jgi:hypothetical protein
MGHSCLRTNFPTPVATFAAPPYPGTSAAGYSRFKQSKDSPDKGYENMGDGDNSLNTIQIDTTIDANAISRFELNMEV